MSKPEAAVPDGEIAVPAAWLGRGRFFALSVADDSMKNAAIINGDTVVVREQSTAAAGEIVVATVAGETTIKRLHLSEHGVRLLPENPDFAPIDVHDGEVTIHGVVVAVMRSLATRKGALLPITGSPKGLDMDDLKSDTQQPARRNLRATPTSTVGRGKAIVLEKRPTVDVHKSDGVSLHFGDSLSFYSSWERPTTIISDGAYGVLGFEGDTSDHLDVPAWYEPHVKAWSEAARPNTTLWFWNSEIGWAAAHPILEKYGWRYVNCNIWNKGVGHIAGNVNTQKIRRFPVVTEVCVQYVFEARVGGLSLKQWLLAEWKRSGLTLRRANEACGVKDAAVRKYLDQGHLWYFPPAEAMQRLSDYANEHGRPEGRPYFSLNGKTPVTGSEWEGMRSKFCCPHGVTNVWERNAVRGEERVKTDDGRAVHLNQKPLDLMSRIIEASTDVGDVIWEPFGGLFTGSLAASRLKRRAFSAEIDSTYFQYGVRRFIDTTRQMPLPAAVSGWPTDASTEV